MKKIFKFCLLFIFAAVFFLNSKNFAQDYFWPTNASRSLTSSFAEFRSGHFHAGIDIKTWGQEGYKVFATRGGYIWKVRISPFGYGKVIYQVLDTGEIAVYAHLQKFSPKLEKIMKQEQKKQQHYSITKVFNTNSLPVEKGELIAFSGKTGIGYPHLHFELRKNENTPINPLQKNFQITDTIAPIPTQIAVIPINTGSQVDGWPTPQTFRLQKITPNSYKITNPVQVWGIIGFGIDAYDQANGVNNKFSINKIKLFLDDTAIFQSHYDSFTYDKTNQIFLDRNFWLIAHSETRFFNLYVEPGNTLNFYEPFSSENGIIYTSGYAKQHIEDMKSLNTWLVQNHESLDDENLDRLYLKTYDKPYTTAQTGRHQVKIVLEDFFRNTSTIEFSIIVNQKIKPENQWININDLNVNLFLENDYKWYQLKQNHWQPFDTAFFLESQGTFEINLNLFEDSRDNQLFKVENKLDDDVSNFPTFIYNKPNSTNKSEFEIEILIRDPYTTFSGFSKQPITSPIYAKIQNDRIGLQLLPLSFHDLNHFSASIPSMNLTNDTTKLTIFTQTSPGTEEILFENQFYFFGINKSEKSIIKSKDGLLSLLVPKSASKQNVYLTIETINLDQFLISIPGDSLSPLFQIGPNDVPFFRPLRLSLEIPPFAENIQQIGIYTPDIQRKKWNFIGNMYNSTENKLYADLASLGMFTLIRDNNPPWFQFIRPKNGEVISNRKPEIIVQFDDDLSSIGGEENYRLSLDENFCISELDPELHQIKFIPDESLQPGNHQLNFWIQDQAGNQIQKSISFTIKGVQ